MAKTLNYHKTCPNCLGKPFLGTIPGKPFWGIFKEPDTLILCKTCNGMGVIKPKEVIQRLDKFEPLIKY